jgi:adenylate kinase family enzyme
VREDFMYSAPATGSGILMIESPRFYGKEYEVDGVTVSDFRELYAGFCSVSVFLKMEVKGKTGEEAKPIFKAFLEKASQFRAILQTGTVEVYSGIEEFALMNTVRPHTINILTKEQEMLLTRLCRIFSPESMKKYDELGISTHYNLLFSGLPGSGKSNLCLEIARRLNRPVMKVSILTTKLIRAIYAVEDPRVFVLEDADELVHNRSDSNAEKSYLGSILTLLDGTTLPHIFILTTNYPQKLDVALSRAGRISVAMKFGWAEDYIIERVCTTYLEGSGSFPTGSGKVVSDAIIRTNAKYTLSMIANFCRTAIFNEKLPEKGDYASFAKESKEFETKWESNPIIGTPVNIYS